MHRKTKLIPKPEKLEDYFEELGFKICRTQKRKFVLFATFHDKSNLNLQNHNGVFSQDARLEMRLLKQFKTYMSWIWLRYKQLLQLKVSFFYWNKLDFLWKRCEFEGRWDVLFELF